MDNTQLIEEAHRAMAKAYVPYSHFPVGAALLTKSGKIYTGCNIENASYPVSNCAERTALFKAVSEGERDFATLAVIAPSKRPVPPCGMCRQAVSEFCSPGMLVILANTDGAVTRTTVAELLPGAFQPEDMDQ
ncbi:cytidine deaminase [Sporolactobacillus sp. THM7-7]|nr:cytidine deaminase [Sporolactobacillus sp. THM7-7]